MTVEAGLFDLLKGMVGNRVFPDVAPINTPRPYITYQQVGGRPVSYLDDAVANRKNGLVQINVWADTRASAAALALQVEAAMIGATAFQARPASGQISQHEPDLQRYGTVQDFDIWSSR